MTDDTSTHEERRTAPLEDAPTSVRSEGHVVAGKYRLDRLVGRGGMGVVYAATHLGLDDRVAVKLLTGSSRDAGARFLREARLSANVKSEHVVRVFDVGTDEGTPFIVMELLEGESLADVLHARGRLDPEEAVVLVRQACVGLALAHARGIVHRDLKPSNLFLVRGPSGPLTKVLDFGIAKEIASTSGESGSVTSATALLGSPLYMAPEQVRLARTVDARADVWSLGVTLFELLTGRLPFVADTTPGILAAVAADAAPSVDVLEPKVPPELARIVARCLEKDPTARFADAGELGEALQRMGANDAVSASLNGVAAAKEPSRAKAPIALVVLVVGVAGLATFVVARARSVDTRDVPVPEIARSAATSAARGPEPVPSAFASVPTAVVSAPATIRAPALRDSSTIRAPSSAPLSVSSIPSARLVPGGLSETQK